MNLSATPPNAPCASTITPNFDRLAPIYRWMEWLTFGPCLRRCRCAFLDQLTHCRRALILGDGDGRFTARLLRVNPFVYIDAVDASPAMLQALMWRAGRHCQRVHAHCSDIRAWQPQNEAYDLIVTHFFLDCLSTDEIISLAGRLQPVTKPGTVWLVSEFNLPPGPISLRIGRLLISLLYRAFGWLTGLRPRSLPDHRAALVKNGFALTCRKTWLHELLVSELWSFS
jgi:ubiquinone/menaquinone biosynthesis C-methylase UbiE